MNNNIIIEEYLNHFFTYEELAKYLCIDIKRVKETLNKATGRTAELIRKHRIIINSYDESDDSLNIENAADERVVDLANYIINNNASIRKAAKEFEISKTSVGEYMNDRLPKISIKLYKQVFEILMSHKSLSVQHKSRRVEVSEEIKLLKQGMNITEISKTMDKSFSSIQRDLANRTETLCPKVHQKIKEQLYNNRRG